MGEGENGKQRWAGWQGRSVWAQERAFLRAVGCCSGVPTAGRIDAC